MMFQPVASMAANAPQNRRWYVVHAQPWAESRAVINLERQGYEVFCPRLSRIVRHARKQTKKHFPLFPCYLFLRLDITRDQWRSVGGTRGVVRLITLGDVPQAVPDGVVEELQARADSQGVIAWAPPLAVGQSVHILEGPFVNFVGRLEKLDGDGRARVLLELLGRSVPAHLHRADLTSAA
jgi:transcription elongation factor/antiterminator RfaH